MYSLSSAFPTSLGILTKRGHLFCTETSMLSPFPPPLPGWPEDVPKSQGLPHHAQIPRNAFLRGVVVIFESSFPFQYPPLLSLCQASAKGFKEFPEGTFRKWLILFAEIHSLYKTSICNFVVMSLSIYSHCVRDLFFFFIFSPSPFP